MVSFSALCFVVGAYMLLCGIAVGVLEVPIFFYCCDLTKKFAPKADLVTPIYRSIAYAAFVSSPFAACDDRSPSLFRMSIFCFFCLGIATIFAALLLLVSSFFYAMTYLGPRVCRRFKSPISPMKSFIVSSPRCRLCRKMTQRTMTPR